MTIMKMMQFAVFYEFNKGTKKRLFDPTDMNMLKMILRLYKENY